MIGSNYFDYAATTPLDPKVLAVMVPYLGDNFYNPSAGYLKALSVKKDFNEARARIAKSIGCKPSEILFTAGGTEANNIAISGILKRYPESNLVISDIEHDSVYEVANCYKNKKLQTNNNGHVSIENLSKLIDEQTVLVSVMFVNNELGTIQPIKQIVEYVRTVREDRHSKGNDLPIFVHTDASQAGNYLSLNVNSLGIDLMTINGGKIYGPKQTAILYVKSKVILEPLIYGGGQEKGYRSGTENVANYIGLSKAIEIAQDNHTKQLRRVSELEAILKSEIIKKIPTAIFNGGIPKTPHIVSVIIPEKDNETIMMCMDEMGYEIAVGSACKASNDEPSRVLTAIGLSESDAQSTIRISMGKYTTKESVLGLVESLQKACQ